MAEATSRSRVVALLGPDSHHRNTLATLIEADVNIVGACIASEKTSNVPVSYILRGIKKRGFVTTLSQILSRLVYRLRNSKLDRDLKRTIFDQHWADQVLNGWAGPTIEVKSYQDDEAQRWVTDLRPELLVVHTGSWVGKRMRDLQSVKHVIGGHPGITPAYRGSHSPFWAILNDDWSSIGWTVFEVEAGVDTGPVIEQGYVDPGENDTYFSLSWKGMVEIARCQARTIKAYEQSGTIRSRAHETIPEGSEYNLPGVLDLARYWFKQKKVR